MILIVKYVKTDKIVIAAQLSKDADVAVAVIAVCRVQPVLWVHSFMLNAEKTLVFKGLEHIKI